MAELTQEEITTLKDVAAAWGGAQRIDELPALSASSDVTRMEFEGSIDGEPCKVGAGTIGSLFSGIKACGRIWDLTLGSPVAVGYYGSADVLRNIQDEFHIGGYIYKDDGSRRKLSKTDHSKYDDGADAKLDGTDGQYMWGLDAHYFTERIVGNLLYRIMSDKPIPGWDSVYIPEMGTSATGFGVIDRTTNTLCSVVSTDERYRGGNGVEISTETKNCIPGSPQQTMLGMPATAKTVASWRQLAQKRGKGWDANWYISDRVKHYVFEIAFGTLNIQTAFNSQRDANGFYQGGFGAGATTAGSQKWSDLNGYYPLIPTDINVHLADGCGLTEYSVRNTADEVVATFQVPRMFGLDYVGFGHLWSQTAGEFVNAGETETIGYVAKSMYEPYNETTLENCLEVGRLPRKEGYIKKSTMRYMAFMPTEVGGSTTTYYGDYFYSNAETSQSYGLRSCLRGGCANDGSNAGSASLYVRNALSASSANFSAALCFFASDPSPIGVETLAKMQQSA